MDDPSPTERDLPARAAKGEKSAIGRLLDGERRRLIRMVELRLDPRAKGRFSASDVVQETFLEATHRFPEHLDHPEVTLRPWLRFLARQQLAAHHRRHVRAARRTIRRDAPADSPPSSPLLIDEVTGHLTSPSRAADREEMRSRVNRALDALDPLDREVLILRQLEGHSNQDAAAGELGLTPAAASKRYVRALERLGSLVRGLTDLEPEGKRGASEPG